MILLNSNSVNMPKNMLLVAEYQRLLRDLKGIVEGLLISRVANVWNVYGGLNRLHSAVETIFKHQCKEFKFDKCSDCWAFIQGLEWLQPDITSSTLSVDIEYQPHLPTHLKTDKVSLWIYRSLESHTLSQKLSWLLSDKQHLLACYHQTAFMCQDKYTEATLICLRAVERSEPTLMSDIDPCLFLNQFGAKDFHKAHRRCSSFPDTRKWNYSIKKLSFDETNTIESPKKTRKAILHRNSTTPSSSKAVCGKLKPWRSLPNLQMSVVTVRKRSATVIKQCSTTPSSPMHSQPQLLTDKLSPSVLRVDYSDLKESHAEKTRQTDKRVAAAVAARKHTLRKRVMIKECEVSQSGNGKGSGNGSGGQQVMSLPCATNADGLQLAMNLVRSAPDYTFSLVARAGQKDLVKRPAKSFIEDGGNSVQPMSTGYFPRPTKGQTLTSFLSSAQFTRANAELDRENAHFSISEAMIAVIEQIKWRRNLKLDEEQGEESDEEINSLKQRIRLRRRQKQMERQRNVWGNDNDACRTEASVSTSPDTDSVDELEMESNLSSAELQGGGLSMSMASLYSEADVVRRPRGTPDGQSDVLSASAEGVALSLISRFNEKQLPRASSLEWLVSEQDAPQQLLPLPVGWLSGVGGGGAPSPALRGTADWAPPRPQIIFTLHPTPVRKTLMCSQNYRCAGCGMKVASQYASRFRYCDYLGRYFCTGCHTNQLALIPARILQKWDFTRYSVSSFSYRLLEQMYNDPLFRVIELNPQLLRKSKNLERCHKLRIQLFYLKDFINTCRFAEEQEIQACLQKEPTCLLTDPHMYSLHDLAQVKSGELQIRLKHLADVCMKHTAECALCMARGFVCEMCSSSDTLFPWQLTRTRRCHTCGACYHATCWTDVTPGTSSPPPYTSSSPPLPCPRCTRIRARLHNQPL